MIAPSDRICVEKSKLATEGGEEKTVDQKRGGEIQSRRTWENREADQIGRFLVADVDGRRVGLRSSIELGSNARRCYSCPRGAIEINR